jgi:hypothetical protein
MCTTAIVHLASNLFGRGIPLEQFVVYFDFLNVKHMKGTAVIEYQERTYAEHPRTRFVYLSDWKCRIARGGWDSMIRSRHRQNVRQ